ncbi:MAG: sulfur carrier protein ThiS [Candidatus Sumerlaeia bacterium]|nr:sulfur carrier protein ThiS [Candidatus Sumerlaeia bacterium]
MSLILNGESRSFPGPLTVERLLAQLPLPAGRVAVLVNGEVAPAAEHAARPVTEGDVIDLISMVGGG